MSTSQKTSRFSWFRRKKPAPPVVQSLDPANDNVSPRPQPSQPPQPSIAHHPAAPDPRLQALQRPTEPRRGSREEDESHSSQNTSKTDIAPTVEHVHPPNTKNLLLAPGRPQNRDPETRSIYEAPDYCMSTWAEALSRCEQELGSEDFDKVSKFETEQDFFESLRNLHQEDGHESMGRLALLSKMEPCLNHLKSFTTLLAIGQGGIQTAVLWGCFNLMIELALNYEDTLKEITEMLKELDHQLGLFHLYQTHAILQNDPGAREEIVNVLVEVIMFTCLIIRFFRRTPIRQMMETLVNIRGRFEVIAASIRTKTQNVKEKIAALQMNNSATEAAFREAQNLPKTQYEFELMNDIAKLPCIYVPWPENTQFYKRKVVFDSIIGALGPDYTSSQAASDRRQRSLAIYGTAGIGKTQLALAYGYHWHNYYHDSANSAVLWVNGEDQLSFAESWTGIANALALPGASPSASGATENEILVKRWLQTTNARWLLIFDNIEDIELLARNWPKTSPGSILVTCRSVTVAAPLIAKSFEIPAFGIEEGSDFLMSIVGRDANLIEQSESEVKNAQALAEKLGGLPLAMFMMATQIKNRRQTFEQFIPFHAKNSRKLSKKHGANLYYKADLQSAWEIPFRSLGPDAAVLMGILSFFGPDSIPHDVFLTDQAGLKDCAEIEFLLDEWSLGEAVQELLDSTLMKRDANTSMYSFHRLIQDQYHYHMKRDVALKNFQLATSLMNAAFPKQIDGRSLRKYSDKCQHLIQHVTALCHSYTELITESPIDYEFEDFTALLSNAAWHLLEMNYFDVVILLLDTGLRNCKDKKTIGHSNILNVAGLVYIERGDFQKGLEMQLKAEAIRKELLPANHPEIANMYNNIGLTVLSLGEVEKAGELFQMAIEIDMQQPKEDRDQILHIRHLNYADVLLLQKKYVECKRQIELGRVYAILTFGTDTHLVAQSDRQLGNCLAAEGKFAEAQEKYEIARRLFMKENPTQKANSTVCLALGRVLIAQGKYKEAVKTLREGLELCEVNETSKGNDGDMARVMRALSEALQLSEDTEEAEALRTKAEAIRKALQGEAYENMPDNQSSWDALVCCLYR